MIIRAHEQSQSKQCVFTGDHPVAWGTGQRGPRSMHVHQPGWRCEQGRGTPASGQASFTGGYAGWHSPERRGGGGGTVVPDLKMTELCSEWGWGWGWGRRAGEEARMRAQLGHGRTVPREPRLLGAPISWAQEHASISFSKKRTKHHRMP